MPTNPLHSSNQERSAHALTSTAGRPGNQLHPYFKRVEVCALAPFNPNTLRSTTQEKIRRCWQAQQEGLETS
eukprot:1152613-Pelagomonas_calceolata.AAC.6